MEILYLLREFWVLLPLVERQDKLCTAFVKRVESFYKPAAQYPLCSVVFLMVLKYLKIKRASLAKSPPANSLGFLWIFALLAFHNAWSFFCVAGHCHELRCSLLLQR